MGVHSKLVKQGVDTASDEYYETINSRMRNTFPEEFGETEELEEKPSKRQSNVVAPATRSTAPKKVRLTQNRWLLLRNLGYPLTYTPKRLQKRWGKYDGWKQN